MTILMCPPKEYGVDYVINPWMDGNIGTVNKQEAGRQWLALRDAISKVTPVVEIEPRAHCPDMVFTANAGVRSEYHKRIILSSFVHFQRRPEEEAFAEWFRDNGFTVVSLPRDVKFEGEGDVLKDDYSGYFFFGYGQRSSLDAYDLTEYDFDPYSTPMLSLELVDPRFYHLDTCFAPLSRGHVLWYPRAFSQKAQETILGFRDNHAGIHLYPVTETEANAFACNLLEVNGEIFMNEGAEHVAYWLRDQGYTVTELPLWEFVKAGGAAKCLTLKI